VNYAVQGIFCELNKCFAHGNEVLYLKPGVFDSCVEGNVRLLIDHEGKSLATTADRLELCLGDDVLTFRAVLPDSWSGSKELTDVAGDVETYLAVSCGFKYNAYETVTIDGAEVKVISNATLTEISLVSAPAVESTYARVVSMDDCNSLEEDQDLIKLTGRVVTLHRKAKALEAGGQIKYSHATTPSDRAANRFTRALKALA
jgi:phage head maturation protease